MLKQFRKYYFLLSSLIFVVGCGDDIPLPIPDDGVVVFELSADIDGEERIWQAGVNNQYMYTYTSEDANGLIQFQGTIGEVGCQFCPNSINFDFVQSQNSNTVDDLFSNGQNINFRDATIPLNIVGYDANFEVNATGTPPFNYVWNFGDGSTVFQTSSSSSNHQFITEGVYNVCVDITDANGYQSTICRDIATDNSMKCSVNFSVHNLNFGSNFANTFFFNTFPSGTPPFHYHWNVPLDTINIQNFVVQSPTVTMNQLGSMSVDVSMIDDDNCNCSLEQTIHFHSLDSSFINHFDYLTTPISAPGVMQDYFSSLNIQYIDENGVVYSSALGEQPNSSFLNIIKIEDFILNEDDFPTKKITLEFDCRLYDENGNYKDLSNGSGTIGVAHE